MFLRFFKLKPAQIDTAVTVAFTAANLVGQTAYNALQIQRENHQTTKEKTESSTSSTRSKSKPMSKLNR